MPLKLKRFFSLQIWTFIKTKKNQNLLLYFSQAFQEIPQLLKKNMTVFQKGNLKKKVWLSQNVSRPFDLKIVSIPLYFAFPEKLGSGMLLCIGLNVQTFQKELIQLSFLILLIFTSQFSKIFTYFSIFMGIYRRFF